MTTSIDTIKQELQDLVEAERHRIQNFGMEGYIPNRMQKKAHMSLARTLLYVGGNRAGKSTFGAMELAYHLTRKYPAWYPEGRRFKGPIKAVVSATEFPIVTRVIEPKITSLLPRDYYKLKRTAQGYMTRLTCKDGSIVDVLTSEMKDDAYESADWDFAWCDEPQNRYKYQAIRRGLVDRRGYCVITFTPLTEPWMKDELVDMADGKRIDVVTVNIRDNLTDIAGNPILNEDSIEEFEASLPDDVKEARIHGHFFHLRGVVYKEFGAEHVKDVKYEKGMPVVAILDPHDRQPHHVVWAFLDKNDDVYFDYEMSTHCELPELARKIRAMEKERGYSMRKRLIDPNFGRKPAASGRNDSVIQELGKHGTPFYEANDDIELGHMLTREWLHYDRSKPVTATNCPKVFFSKEGCPLTIRSMRNLQYEEWKGNTKNERDPKESPKQKDTHGADCVRYLLITKPSYQKLAVRSRSTETDGPIY